MQSPGENGWTCLETTYEMCEQGGTSHLDLTQKISLVKEEKTRCARPSGATDPAIPTVEVAMSTADDRSSGGVLRVRNNIFVGIASMLYISAVILTKGARSLGSFNATIG
jgi:hypothetical protein